jgi:hypothetical protein
MWDWRKEQLWHGVCAACRDWVVENHDDNYDGCVCLENHLGRRNHTWPVNSGGRLIDHMCHEHDFQYWVDICQDANAELQWRMRHERVPWRKRNTGGHGWTRPKGKRVGARGVLRERTTPAQRRADTQVIHPYLQPLAVPICFCGQKIHARGHQRLGVPHRLSPLNQPLTMRARSCVGCNGFKRNW